MQGHIFKIVQYFHIIIHLFINVDVNKKSKYFISFNDKSKNQPSVEDIRGGCKFDFYNTNDKRYCLSQGYSL